VAEGERVVLRLLDRDSSLLPLAALGMESAAEGAFRELLGESHGMIVVSGPTGSGKTTTLYASLCHLDAARRNIMTIEDPIEYQLPDIGQIQVKPKIGLTFAAGLRHVLRQDPDVILVGETRDLETAEIAVRAALTGHLVFTTLHTNDAAGAIARLLDMGMEPYLLGACLRGVLAQRLVRRLCPSCRRPAAFSAAEAVRLRAPPDLAGRAVFEPAGCERCLEGYRGRTGLFELLVIDDDARRWVGSAGGDELRARVGRGCGGSLAEDAVRKILAGLTSVREALTAVRA
jgi:general secretion pathway protein E